MLSNKPVYCSATFFAIQAMALMTFLCAPIVANSRFEPLPASVLLSDKFGSFRATTAATTLSNASDNPSDAAEKISSASRTYTTNSGERFVVHVISANSESAAYAYLTSTRNLIAKTETPALNSALAEFVFPGKVLFAKGKVFVEIDVSGNLKAKSASLQEISNAFSATLPDGEGDVPVLVKHLPDWQNVVGRASYFVTLAPLTSIFPSPLFDSIDFEGAEAVAADYDAGQLVIIEFQTPQLATENDQRIKERLRQFDDPTSRTELATAALLPTVYRRVGNYGIFVFNGSSEPAANQLIDQVKYEQITKWLGDSPYPLLEAQRAYRETTLNMLVSVVKASGLAILICFSVGGLFGGLLFIRRRAQQRTIDAYSDAGGMLRLNLDEMTPESNAARLVGPGN